MRFSGVERRMTAIFRLHPRTIGLNHTVASVWSIYQTVCDARPKPGQERHGLGRLDQQGRVERALGDLRVKHHLASYGAASWVGSLLGSGAFWSCAFWSVLSF